jgi:hypothetical protein
MFSLKLRLFIPNHLDRMFEADIDGSFGYAYISGNIRLRLNGNVTIGLGLNHGDGNQVHHAFHFRISLQHIEGTVDAHQ